MKHQRWLVLVIVSVAYFVSQLDATAVVVALPSIGEDLGDNSGRIWVVTGYILSMAVALVASGRLGDLVGHRRIFALGIVVFSLSSAAAGLAPELGFLIGARVVQGLGAAMMAPQTLALLAEAFPDEKRGLAFGIRGAAGGVAAIAGPVVGGLLVSGPGWRWIFLMNIPLGVVMLALTFISVPASAAKGESKIDWLGIVLGAASLLLICVAISERQRFDSQLGFGLVVGLALALTFAFTVRQKAEANTHPLVDFELFKSRNFSLVNAYSLLAGCMVLALVILVSEYLQSTGGLTPLEVGYILLPASLLATVFDPIAGALCDKGHAKSLMMAAMFLTIVAIGWFYLLTPERASVAYLIGPMAVIGVGNAFLFTPISILGLRGVGPEDVGVASGLLVTALQVGSLTGAAIAGALVVESETIQNKPSSLFWVAGLCVIGALIATAIRGSEVGAPDAAGQADQANEASEAVDAAS